MRFLVLCVLVVLVSVMVGGCVGNMSREDRDDLARLVVRYEKLRKDLEEVGARFESGDLTSKEAKETAAGIGRLIEDTKLEMDDIRNKGYSSLDIALGIGRVLGEFALAFLGINIYRSRKHPLTKEIT